ncbi:unnamed protein product [Dicrocoelium dendriticum]|nr:unnamed protein product [Dicrocoelium dendriticum]
MSRVPSPPAALVFSKLHHRFPRVQLKRIPFYVKFTYIIYYRLRNHEVQANAHNYDVWFDYVRLMEEEGSVDQTREIYERAVANVPPIEEKRYWRRYIYLWLNYALYEELNVADMERAGQVYRFCLKLIPHRRFTFAKMWLYAAKFEIRRKALTDARKLLVSTP